MVSPKVFVMMLVVTASVVAITVLHSQNAMASAYAGQTSGPTRTGMADLDVAEAEEAGNATMMTNQTTNGNTTDVQFLAIQNAQSGSLSQINATAYTLELNNVANKTVQFSDRPERVVETVSTANFVGNWSTGQNSFSSDEPNDALIVEDTQTGNLDTFVIESFNPVYDIATNSLTYTITAENATINLLGVWTVCFSDRRPQSRRLSIPLSTTTYSLEEDVEAGNATTTMMINQTADGNMTSGTNSTS